MKHLMRSFSLIALSAVALGIGANSALPPGTQDEIEKSFQVRPGGLLTFDAELADAEIVTEDTGAIRVEFKRRFKVDTAREADELRKKLSIEMAQSDNNVKVIVRFADDRNQTNRGKVQLDFRITMPRKFNLELRTAGSATVADLDGTATVSTAGGSLTLGNINGPVRAKSEGGSLQVGNVGGDLQARSYGGSVTLGRINGRATTLAEGGSISMAGAGEIVEATANGGSVKASISKPPHSACTITAKAGSIELQLPASAAANIDAACTGGGIMSEFAVAGDAGGERTRLKGDINGGGPVLILRATAGSIHLRKGGQ